MKAHNKLPEFVFGILDRLVRIRPNASTLANEAFLLYCYNKTGKWLQDLPEEKRIKVIADARMETKEFRAKYKERQRQIETKRKEKLEHKRAEIERIRKERYNKKKKMTSEMIHCCLWQSVSDRRVRFMSVALSGHRGVVPTMAKLCLKELPLTKGTLFAGERTSTVESTTKAQLILATQAQLARDQPRAGKASGDRFRIPFKKGKGSGGGQARKAMKGGGNSSSTETGGNQKGAGGGKK